VEKRQTGALEGTNAYEDVEGGCGRRMGHASIIGFTEPRNHEHWRESSIRLAPALFPASKGEG